MNVTARMTAELDIRQVIQSVVDGHELDTATAAAVMNAIMSGRVTDAQIGALVTGLRIKGETVEEIVGFAQAMRDHALAVEVDSDDTPLLDTCGTGGDHSNSFNISTTATFVIAAAGVRIAKHGNRAASSRCGSADLLEALGVAVELSARQVAESIDRTGIGFIYAPAFHPAMRFVGPARREIGIRTIFNVLGPLTNPAGAKHQLIGIGHPAIAAKLAAVLGRLGARHAVLVHSEEGLDEVGIVGTTQVTEYDARRGQIDTYLLAPEDFGLERGDGRALAGGDADTNAKITLSILNGEQGPRRSVTLMNAGAGIFAADAVDSMQEGVRMAAEAIDSGRALKKLEELVTVTQELAAGGLGTQA